MFDEDFPYPIGRRPRKDRHGHRSFSDVNIILDPSVKRGISVRMLWRQKVAKKRRRTRWVRRGFFVIPFGPNGSCRKPRLTDGSRLISYSAYSILSLLELGLQIYTIIEPLSIKNRNYSAQKIC